MSISVIIATYGGDEWLKTRERAVISCENQGFRDWMIYHDPFSDSVSEVRNAAAVDAGGEWLAFLDGDDEFAPGYVGAMESRIKASSATNRVLFTPAVQIVRAGRPAGVAHSHFFREVPLRQANWMVVGTLIHRDLFWEVGGFPEYPHGFEDFALWSKCVRVGAQIVRVPDAIYRYHANPHSKHKELWKDKKTQRETHHRVIRELDEWEAARA